MFPTFLCHVDKVRLGQIHKNIFSATFVKIGSVNLYPFVRFQWGEIRCKRFAPNAVMQGRRKVPVIHNEAHFLETCT
jgi:hypothetical protein